MRTIGNLLTMEGRVYIHCASRTLAAVFLKNAEAEGFTFGDGVKPTQRETDDIFALNQNWTINYVGWAGHLAFQCAAEVGGKPLIRVDYGKYLAGCSEYIICSQTNSSSLLFL